jgi:ABC-type phosphate/phosphonate transport system substrate-binding protein
MFEKGIFSKHKEKLRIKDITPEKQPKEVKTGITSTKSGKEIIARWTPVYDELGLIDEGQEISIYWYAKDTEKIIKALREAMKV